MTRRFLSSAMVTTLAIAALLGCTGGSGPEASGARHGEASVQPGGITATAQRDGPRVTFSWQPVAGAVRYSVFVFDNPDAPPIWTWRGRETRVVFGGAPFTVRESLQQLSADTRSGRPLFSEVALPASPSWTLIALDGDDNLVAVRPVGRLQ